MKRFFMLLTILISLAGLTACRSNNIDREAFQIYLDAMAMANIAPGDIGAVDTSVYMVMEMQFLGDVMSTGVISRSQMISDGQSFWLNSVQELDMFGELVMHHIRMTIEGDEVTFINVLEDGRPIDPSLVLGEDFYRRALNPGGMPEFDEIWLTYASMRPDGQNTVIELVFDGPGMLEGDALRELVPPDSDTVVSDVAVSLVLGADGMPSFLAMEMVLGTTAIGQPTDMMMRVVSVFHAFGDDVVITPFS
ncbi:MAG: hypothetical protein LBE35_08015 [Clostridiales bacterium]|jgi:hypothetical protein|nr:hypothetical protein [Clostridiales bacterium]